MKKFLFSNIPQKIVAVLIALLLWQMVLIVENPERGQTFLVPIEYVDRPSDLVVVQEPENLSVEVRYLTQTPVQVSPTDITVRVSLKDAQPGKNEYPVEVIAADRIKADVLLVTMTDDVIVEMDLLVAKELPIRTQDVKFTSLRDGFKLSGFSTDPPSVRIRGAERHVNAAVRAQITVDLSRMENAAVYERKVEILDAEGNPVPLTRVAVDPETVEFRPNLEAQLFRVLLIAPVFEGSLEPGYRIESYEMTPNQIRGRGDSALLASLSTIETEPIDLTGLREDRSFSVKYVLPPGVTRDPTSPEVIRVRVRVVKDGSQVDGNG